MQKNGGNLGGDSDQVMKGANFVRYQQTKLANVAFTYALHKRLQEAGSKVKALVAHPGGCSHPAGSGHHESWRRKRSCALSAVGQQRFLQGDALWSF